MKIFRRFYWNFLFICAGCFLLFAQSAFSVPDKSVHLIQLNDDTINPVTAEYISQSIDRAYEEKAECLIIKMDTPGGLLNSTRLIVKNMLKAKVPVVVYIAPSGSRAGSAGVFITYASHIAAMAPSTNIGAAHPVQMGPEGGKGPRDDDWKELKKLLEELKQEKKDKASESSEENVQEERKDKKKRLSRRERKKQEEEEAAKTQEEPKIKEEDQETEELFHDEHPMESKILQDTVAFIKAIAKERGRSVEWAVDSVVKSSSITAEEALAKGVVEIIARDDNDLLEQLDGRVVKINEEEVTLHTKDAVIQNISMDARQQFFNVLANPNIAYFLLILGFYGLLFEVTHPGFGVPGVLGVIFLILAFYSMQTLPTNYAGLALLALGVGLLVAEIYVPGFGLLTLGGLVCMALGSMLLFQSVDPIMRVSWELVGAFSLTTAAITFFGLRLILMTRKRKVLGGQEGLVGEKGEADSEIGPGKEGKVFVHGELWNAVSEESISIGEPIVVEKMDGLKLKVKRIQKES